MKKKEKTLPGYFIPAWSTQSVSYAVAFLILGYLTYYCTNIIGLSASGVGMMLLIAKLFDGVTDLVAAVLIERTNSRWGKGRPYVLLMPVAWIFIVLTFSTPNIGKIWQVFYIFVCYFMVNSVCITLFSAAEPVHLARALKNTEDSSTVLSLSGMIMGAAGGVLSVAFPLMITGIGTREHGWTLIALILGVPCCILSFIRFAFIKERKDIPVNDTKNGHRFGLGDMVRVLINNKHVLILLLMQILANVFSGLGTAVTTYYFQYIMGDINMQATVAATQLVGMLMLAAVPAIIKRTSIKKVMTGGIILGIIGNLMRIIPNFYVLLIGNLFTGIAVIPTGMLLPSLLIDCMDYNEWKTGERVEAIFGSMNSLGMKLGSGLASVLAGFVMGITGYNGMAAVQSATAQQGIIALYSWIPAIMFLIMLIAFHFYKIDKEMPKVRVELEQRRAGSRQ